jgi:predicted methyltransferase
MEVKGMSMRTERSLGLASAGLLFLMVGATAVLAGEPIDYGAQIVAAPDRDARDIASDYWRHPAKFLDFSGVRPGMTVLDMLPVDGYTTELLARAVGGGGRVFAEIPPGSSKQGHQALIERMTRPVMSNVELSERPVETPVPRGEHALDLVTLIWNYHDILDMPVDRGKMNKALFDGLKKGGTLVIIDFAELPRGTSGTSPRTIDKSAIISELEAAGFQKVAEGNFLRQPGEPRDQPYGVMENTADQFALKFRKP